MKKLCFDPFQKADDVKKLPVRPADTIHVKSFLSWVYNEGFPKDGCKGTLMRESDKRNYYHLYFTTDEIDYNPEIAKEWLEENKIHTPSYKYKDYNKLHGESRKEYFNSMKNILVLDTEFGKVSYKGQMIREVSWIMYSMEDGHKEYNSTPSRIKDDDKEGKIIQIEDLRTAIEKADLIIGHNIESDFDALYCACINLEIPPLEITNEVFDTACEANNLCQLYTDNEKHGYKYPKLIELINYLNIDAESKHYRRDNHSSKKDVEVTLECFLEMLKINETTGFLYE